MTSRCPHALRPGHDDEPIPDDAVRDEHRRRESLAGERLDRVAPEFRNTQRHARRYSMRTALNVTGLGYGPAWLRC